MDFNSSMISFNLCSRLAWSLIATWSALGVCKYARFSFWISAISCLSASTRSRIPPSTTGDYTGSVRARNARVSVLNLRFEFSSVWWTTSNSQMREATRRLWVHSFGFVPNACRSTVSFASSVQMTSADNIFSPGQRQAPTTRVERIRIWRDVWPVEESELLWQACSCLAPVRFWLRTTRSRRLN